MGAAAAFIGVVLLFLAYWVFRTVQAEKVNKAWGVVAKEFGLKLRTGEIRIMEGNYEGIEIKVETLLDIGMDGFDGNNTLYRVSFPELGLGLGVAREGNIEKVQKSLGKQDIEVNDKDFDDSFLIQGKPDEVQAFLNRPRRMIIKRLFSKLGNSCIIADKEITHQTESLDNDPELVFTKVFILLRTAKSLLEDSRDIALDEYSFIQKEEKALYDALQELKVKLY